jgi:murein DD-endopeptidase MepM/ murein hydrolase activator NlpD
MSSVFLSLKGQELSSPFNFPLQLSGNFCELRSNHFHAGIDIRTKGTEGHTVHAVADGYISKVSVNPAGYGNAVYITHPNKKIMTVYGHLQRFTSSVAERIKEKQYKEESFSVELNFDSTAFPVKQGDVMAYSGNSGSSGGPHLHLEIRDLENNEVIDPLIYYKSMIPDARKPALQGIIVYPLAGEGIVNGSAEKQRIEIKYDKNENPVFHAQIEAFGKIALGIRAIDRMNGTDFSYGLKDIVVKIDDTEIFHSNSQRFSIDELKYINTYIDYEEWAEKKLFYIKTFIDPGNKMRFISSKNSGIIDMEDERIYNITFILTDIYGNKSTMPFKIKSKKQKIDPLDTKELDLLEWDKNNKFTKDGIYLSIPENSLYKNLYLKYTTNAMSGFYSKIHQINRFPVPLHKPAKIVIRIDSLTPDTDTKKYGIVKVKQNRITSWIGGKYKDGWIESEITELNDYSVGRDTVSPIITPLNPAKWRENSQIKIKISDNLSGIYSFRGEIDDKYALFEYDAKNSLLKYTFDNEKLHPGDHHLKLTVSDRCNNKSIYEKRFVR